MKNSFLNLLVSGLMMTATAFVSAPVEAKLTEAERLAEEKATRELNERSLKFIRSGDPQFNPAIVSPQQQREQLEAVTTDNESNMPTAPENCPACAKEIGRFYRFQNSNPEKQAGSGKGRPTQTSERAN